MAPLRFESADEIELAVAPDRQRLRILRLAALSIADHMAWADLSDAAYADSLFSASWFTQSVLAHYDPNQFYRLFVVENADGSWDGITIMARLGQLGRMPFRHLKNQLDANQFLGVPLVRPGAEKQFWAVLLSGLDRAGLECSGLRLSEMPLDHRVTRSLHSHCEENDRQIETMLRKERAAWRGLSLTNNGSISTRRQRRLTSLERQLRELHGPIERQQVRNSAELEQWIAEFLALELAGWKGERDSALASDSPTAAHFSHIARTAFTKGGFTALALRAAGRPIAMTCYFLNGGHGFGFKMAYDRDFARFAPGILLKLWVMKRHSDVAELYFDSCSEPDATMINELWPERRAIVDLAIAIGDDRDRNLFAKAMAGRKFWHQAKHWWKAAALASPF